MASSSNRSTSLLSDVQAPAVELSADTGIGVGFLTASSAPLASLPGTHVTESSPLAAPPPSPADTHVAGAEASVSITVGDSKEEAKDQPVVSRAHYDDESGVNTRNAIDQYTSEKMEKAAELAGRMLRAAWNVAKNAGPTFIYPIGRTTYTTVARTPEYAGAILSIPAVVFDVVTPVNAHTARCSIPLFNPAIAMGVDTYQLTSSAWKAKGHDRWINPMGAVAALATASYTAMQGYCMVSNAFHGNIDHWYNPVQHVSWNPFASIDYTNSHSLDSTGWKCAGQITAITLATAVAAKYGYTWAREMVITRIPDALSDLTYTILDDGLRRHKAGKTPGGDSATYMQRYVAGDSFWDLVASQDVFGRTLEAALSIPSALAASPWKDVSTRLDSTKTWTNAKTWFNKKTGKMKMRAMDCLESSEPAEDKGHTRYAPIPQAPASFEAILSRKSEQFITTLLYGSFFYPNGKNPTTNKLDHLVLQTFKVNRNLHFRGELPKEPSFLPTGEKRPAIIAKDWQDIAKKDPFIIGLFEKEGLADAEAAPIYAEAIYYIMTDQKQKLAELKRKVLAPVASAPVEVASPRAILTVPH